MRPGARQRQKHGSVRPQAGAVLPAFRRRDVGGAALYPHHVRQPSIDQVQPARGLGRQLRQRRVQRVGQRGAREAGGRKSLQGGLGEEAVHGELGAEPLVCGRPLEAQAGAHLGHGVPRGVAVGLAPRPHLPRVKVSQLLLQLELQRGPPGLRQLWRHPQLERRPGVGAELHRPPRRARQRRPGREGIHKARRQEAKGVQRDAAAKPGEAQLCSAPHEAR
mmetsp:Transcript_41158/g.132452  ORF Transcript_41158/g.132452 Transcript_41158/m.132452 type:complete len:220 (+) Transcript_41158:1356-2015(+)